VIISFICNLKLNTSSIFLLPAPQCGRPYNNELNRKNGSANGRIGAKVAVAQSHGEQLL